MRLLLCAIGKFKSGPEAALYAHYADRLPWKLTLKEYDVKKALAGAQRMEAEAEWLLKASEGSDHIVVLDEKGDEARSADFARHLGRCRDQGDRQIAFLIGGADGHAPAALARAHWRLSLGRVTWPHLLVRGLLAEQLYRAGAILSGHPYHRE